MVNWISKITSKIAKIFRSLFGGMKQRFEPQLKDYDVTGPKVVEPKYWPETIELMENLDRIIQEHTKASPTNDQINKRILEYVEEQINTKGSIEDTKLRAEALETVADRILSTTLDKIVGLEPQTDTRMEFSNAVAEFKQKLSQRLQSDILH